MAEIYVDFSEAQRVFDQLKDSIADFPEQNDLDTGNNELKTVTELASIEQMYQSEVYAYLEALATVERDAWSLIGKLEEADATLAQTTKSK
ncbi:Uncharacterised protein [Niallia circulans]|uniref:DUF5344 family protein n=1 Tax=Shouchella clausii TaxID=79880 RepID=UPI000793DB26|nr:DUF5344 family protein [Shouchella clausii]SPU21486.1 Uncharacterised protein [Niallia circulans]KKI87468.1 hypothetical protein WZ76_05295 [Shouchella clausii]MCM3551047.1 YwqI/YxiC family protein [Shouchella clausii]MDO7266393.1 DUF5344 family protein [Shouchella clausii]MDO7286692.1 DUF5344 family protein [Shouchella clausii]